MTGCIVSMYRIREEKAVGGGGGRSEEGKETVLETRHKNYNCCVKKSPVNSPIVLPFLFTDEIITKPKPS